MVFPEHEKSSVNLKQEYVFGVISIELTSTSAGLRSGGSIGVGLHSCCSCLGEVSCCFVLISLCVSPFGVYEILILKLYSGHKDIETVNNMKDSS